MKKDMPISPGKMPGKHSLMVWLKQLSVKNKFIIIIILIMLLLLFELGNFWLSMRIMSGIRDYIGGEAQYSKAQIASYGHMVQYATSHNEADYQKFLDAINIPYKYDLVRRELEKPNPDDNFIRKTWIEVGIDPSDINDCFFLYRNFKEVVYMKKSLQIWVSVDAKILSFIDLGQQIHNVISSPTDSTNPGQQITKDVQVASLMQQFSTLNDKMQVQEKEFSLSLAEGYRAIRDILLLVTMMLTAILGAFVILISVLITRMVIQVDRDKGDFIRIANHQLNTPLSIMKNTYTMVEDGSLTMQKGFEYLGSGLKRMVNVFEDIKSVLQFEGQIQYDIQKADIAAAMEKAVAYGRETIITNKKDITITIAKPAFQIPLVWCDIKQMDNAIHNLLDNAIYYTSKGSITISYEKVDNKYIKVNIKDTGIGFSQEDKQKLGQRFYRSKKALLSHPDGSGLGLYICRNVLESNRGKLLFESEGEGKGSAFGFILPIA